MNERHMNIDEIRRQEARERLERLRSQATRVLNMLQTEQLQKRYKSQKIRHEVGFYDIEDEGATPAIDLEDNDAT